MKANVGGIDRVLRIILGCAMLGTGYYFKSWLGLIGIGPILTGFFRFCPAYPLIGLNTCKLPDGK